MGKKVSSLSYLSEIQRISGGAQKKSDPSSSSKIFLLVFVLTMVLFSVALTQNNALALGNLEVTKIVDWSGSMPDTNKTFEICISGPSYQTGTEDGACQDADSDGDTLTWSNIDVGNYTVTETNPGADWTVDVTGSPATVGDSQTAQAEVTNTRRTSNITINKEVIGEGADEDLEFHFFFNSSLLDYYGHFYLSEAESNSPGRVDEADGVFEDIPYGNLFTVDERNLPANWALKDIACNDSDATIVIRLDENKVEIRSVRDEDIECTFINTPTGDLELIKYHDLDGNGQWDQDEPGLEGWEFTVYDENGEVASGVTGQDGIFLVDGLPVGEYQVCETEEDGWVNSDPGGEEACKDVTVEFGGEVTVLFGNHEADEDGDGVMDDEDYCPDTLLPEYVPTRRLIKGRYADIDGDGVFEKRKKYLKPKDSKYTIEDTYGCSCEQILDVKPGRNKLEEKFGCTKGTIKTFIRKKGWAKKFFE